MRWILTSDILLSTQILKNKTLKSLLCKQCAVMFSERYLLLYRAALKSYVKILLSSNIFSQHI